MSILEKLEQKDAKPIGIAAKVLEKAKVESGDQDDTDPGLQMVTSHLMKAVQAGDERAATRFLRDFVKMTGALDG